MINIGQIFKSERLKMQKTQQQVAKANGVSRPYYADVERNKKTPSLKLLSRLAVFFDIDLNFLKESNAVVYGMEMENQTYIEDYKQEGNVVTYKRTGTNNEFYDNTFDEAYENAKMLYSTATVTKK